MWVRSATGNTRRSCAYGITAIVAACVVLTALPAVASADLSIPAQCSATGDSASGCVAAAEAAGYTWFESAGVTPSCYSDSACDGYSGTAPPVGTIDSSATALTDEAGDWGLQIDVLVPESDGIPCQDSMGCSPGVTATPGFINGTPDFYGPSCSSGSTINVYGTVDSCVATPSYVDAGSGVTTSDGFTVPNYDDAIGNVESSVTTVLPDALVIGATLLAICAGWALLRRFAR